MKINENEELNKTETMENINILLNNGYILSSIIDSLIDF